MAKLFLKQRRDQRDDTKVVVRKQTSDERNKADYYIYLGQIIGRAVLFFFLGIVVNGVLERL